MRLDQLADKRIAILGLGAEGRSVYEVLRQRFPDMRLTIICEQAPDESVQHRHSHVVVESLSLARLQAFDVLVKSPGISLYHPAIKAAQQHGVRVTSGTNIWFAERSDEVVVAITGSKGKSTTATLTAHLFEQVGLSVKLAGNIGLPLIELLDQKADIWVLELSSFQVADLYAELDLAVLLSWFPEHLDWHGDAETYQRDKFRLLQLADNQLVSSEVLLLVKSALPDCLPDVYDQPDGWQVDANGISWKGEMLLSSEQIPLPGMHNWRNACAALTIVEHYSKCYQITQSQALNALKTFKPLPHRLEVVAVDGRCTYVNDSIATTPLATVMALRAFTGRSVILLVGGYDRGLDWLPVMAQLDSEPIAGLIGLPVTGYRLVDQLKTTNTTISQVYKASDLKDALDRVRSIQQPDTEQVVLLSPGAASFGQFRNFVERGETFSRLVKALS